MTTFGCHQHICVTYCTFVDILLCWSLLWIIDVVATKAINFFPLFAACLIFSGIMKAKPPDRDFQSRSNWKIQIQYPKAEVPSGKRCYLQFLKSKKALSIASTIWESLDLPWPNIQMKIFLFLVLGVLSVCDSYEKYCQPININSSTVCVHVYTCVVYKTLILLNIFITWDFSNK